MPGLKNVRALGGLVLLTTVGFTFLIDTYTSPAQAQTQGMQRRDDRRGTRQEARVEKHECNASGQSSRAGCRQEKRDEKQTGRADRANPGPSTPTNP